jgi:hypothetical protein
VNRISRPEIFARKNTREAWAAAAMAKHGFTGSRKEVLGPGTIGMSQYVQGRRNNVNVYAYGNKNKRTDRGPRSEFAHLGAVIITNHGADKTVRQPSFKRSEPEKAHTGSFGQPKNEKKSEHDGDGDEEMEDGELRERYTKEMKGGRERDDGDPEERESVPTVSAALAKFAAGELRGRKWKGRVDELDAKETRMEAVVENDSDDEQQIIGEDHAF